MSDAIIAGSDATFDAEVLKSDLPVLVDFWAPWCGPCLMIAPVVEEIAESHKGKLKVVKMNVDENGQTPQTYGIMAIPTLILFKGGQAKEKIVGAFDQEPSSSTASPSTSDPAMGAAWDVVIVGAGPAGLAAALYTGRARLSTVVLEKGVPGGQILLTDWVENYPGFPAGVAPFDLMQSFRKQAETFGARIESDEVLAIAKVERRDSSSRGTKETYEARAVIVATGSAYRRLGVPGEERLTGSGVSYCADLRRGFLRRARHRRRRRRR